MFFDPSSFKERTLNMGYFNEWAGQIANSYFNAGVAPTETLCKIAQQEELTPHQVSVLAAEANKEIHKHKYASAKDKYHAADFPLADAKQALGRIQGDGGSVKVAEAMPEPVFADRAPDMHAMWGVKPEEFDKTASVKSHLKHASVHGDLLKQKSGDEALLAKYAEESAEQRLIKEARQVVLQGENSAERISILGRLDHFVKTAGVPAGRKPLAKVAFVLGREGLLSPKHANEAFNYLIKSADQTAPEAMISGWIPAQIINGEHPLYISLKTFDECHRKHCEAGRKDKLIQDQLNVVKQKVREL